MQIKVALAGQPNCGKSTVFNMISGIRQHIANYPGVTVDKKSGFFSIADVDVEMVDLPGTYSFSSYSLEEKVAKEFIVNEKPDVILNIIDASNLKRNLYLTFQLLEIGVPVVIVLNMLDVAKRRGIIIDAGKIAKILKCPVICASASKGEGKAEILDIRGESEHFKEECASLQERLSVAAGENLALTQKISQLEAENKKLKEASKKAEKNRAESASKPNEPKDLNLGGNE